jgi:hypothetical protein
LPLVGKPLGWVYTGGEAIINLFDDSTVLSFAMLSLSQHGDMYSAGLVAGKFTKIAIYYYLQGWILAEY